MIRVVKTLQTRMTLPKLHILPITLLNYQVIFVIKTKNEKAVKVGLEVFREVSYKNVDILEIAL